MNLKEIFEGLIARYSDDAIIAETYWHEIQKKYTEKGRYYHNLSHLENLYILLNGVKEEIANWDVLLFSLFYHDLVYSATKKDNKEKSAGIAVLRMKAISVPPEKIDACYNQILATKKHEFSADNDTNLFTDADLSILGVPPEKYDEYYKNVRKEYRIYPDFLYNPGRKKALQHFLDMPQLYKTPYFITHYEAQTRKNVKTEIESLTTV